jgi:hypothetical protein
MKCVTVFLRRVVEAQKNGLFDAEIIPVKVKLITQDGRESHAMVDILSWIHFTKTL